MMKKKYVKNISTKELHKEIDLIQSCINRILQDNYSLILILKQRRWRCSNPECRYDTSESFKFVNRQRRTTNATDMLIVNAYRNLLETSASIANPQTKPSKTGILKGSAPHD